MRMNVKLQIMAGLGQFFQLTENGFSLFSDPGRLVLGLSESDEVAGVHKESQSRSVSLHGLSQMRRRREHAGFEASGIGAEVELVVKSDQEMHLG